jgi:hypothetical protein
MSDLSALRAHRGFMQLWWSRLAGVSAAQMLMVAVGWQVYELTGSAWDLGLVGLMQFVPALLLALASWGGWASRGLLLGISVVLGAVRAFQMPATQALTPLLVPPALLARALAFSSGGLQAAVIAGPALGGFVHAAGGGAVYGLCAALFALAATLTVRIRYAHAPPPHEPTSLHTLLAGVRFVCGHKVVLGAVSLDLFAVLLGGAVALLPMFAKDVLHVGPGGLGLLRAAPAMGALVMSVWLSRWPVESRAGAKLLSAVAVFGAAQLLFGLSTLFWLSMVALTASGAADMVSVVVRQTLVQLETPDAMRGRVSAANGLFIGASNQLGEFESGAGAAWLGAVGSVVLGGLGTLAVAAMWWRLFPALARRDKFN